MPWRFEADEAYPCVAAGLVGGRPKNRRGNPHRRDASGVSGVSRFVWPGNPSHRRRIEGRVAELTPANGHRPRAWRGDDAEMGRVGARLSRAAARRVGGCRPSGRQPQEASVVWRYRSKRARPSVCPLTRRPAMGAVSLPRLRRASEPSSRAPQAGRAEREPGWREGLCRRRSPATGVKLRGRASTSR